MKDEEIINSILSGEYKKPARRLYNYFPVIKKFIQKNNGNKEDAEDIFQDALLVFFKRVRSGPFQLSSSLDTYLFGICKNLWLEELRRKKKVLASDTLSASSIDESFATTIEENKKAEKAFNAISMLGEKCRELLRMFYYKKSNMREIAKKLGFAGEAGAKNQKYRCIEKAKEIYLTLN